MRTKITNKLIAFKAPNTFAKKLDKYANLEMMSKSDIIRQAVQAQFKQFDEKYTSPANSTWKSLNRA